MGQSNPSFNNYAINRIDRVSIPASASQQLRRKMLNLYVPNRLRAKIIWNLIQYSDLAAQFLRFSNRTVGPSSRLEHFDWVQWMVQINQILGIEELVPAFYFPPQNNRKKCSALIFNSDGTPVAYAKLAWGNEEIKQAKNEREAYLFCNQIGFHHIETSKILFSGEFEDRYYNLISVFPSDIKLAPKSWGEVYQLAWEELSTSTNQAIRLNNLPWWNERRIWNDEWMMAFEIVERNEPKNGYQFCLAHGDFSIWNSRVWCNRLYLFDWEVYERVAPLFLDPFYFFFSREILLNKVKDTSTTIKAIRSEFSLISKIHPHLSDLLLVLTYLKIHNQGRKLDRELENLKSTFIQSGL